VGIVTNQRGIARGKLSEPDLRAIHAHLSAQLARQGAHVDAIYHCPHALDACGCRKPQPGLLLRAQAEHPAISFAQAVVVGDSASDVEAGRRVGTSTVLLARAAGSATGPAGGHNHGADHVARTLLDAVRWLREERDLAAGPRPVPSA
jgi:D-glycero-D-manno-heptose 1,7-bisphosphate phosphatase